MVHCSHYSKLARAIDVFVWFIIALPVIKYTERAHYFMSARMSRTHIKLRMLSTLAARFAFTLRTQPVSTRVSLVVQSKLGQHGSARFSLHWIAFTLVVTRAEKASVNGVLVAW